MKTYSFKTKNGFRVDVKGSSLQAVVNKIKSFPHFRSILTGEYFKYDIDGFHANYKGWETIEIEWNK